jgi:hypothetical protein
MNGVYSFEVNGIDLVMKDFGIINRRMAEHQINFVAALAEAEYNKYMKEGNNEKAQMFKSACDAVANMLFYF